MDLPAYRRSLASGKPDQNLASRIDASFERLHLSQTDYGLLLDVTPEGLGLRNRQHLAPTLLRQGWKEAFQAGTAGTNRIEKLILELRELVVHIGDTSNLILDPDLDSYYLMDVSLLAIPDAIMRLHAELDRLDDPARSADLEAGNIFRTIFQSFDLARIEASSRTALQEDQNFLGLSFSLQEKLPKSLDDFLAITHRLASLTDNSGNYLALLEESLSATADYWDTLNTELAILLDTRIQDYQDALWMSLTEELNRSIGKFRALIRTLDISSGTMASSSGVIKDGSSDSKTLCSR